MLVVSVKFDPFRNVHGAEFAALIADCWYLSKLKNKLSGDYKGHALKKGALPNAMSAEGGTVVKIFKEILHHRDSTGCLLVLEVAKTGGRG